MTDEELIQYNLQGLIPGPHESEEAFTKRVSYCLNLKQNLEEELEIPEKIDVNESSKMLKEVAPKLKEQFGFSLDWVPIIFSNHRLAPWHGGCAWIFQSTPESPLGAFFQLRKAFKTSAAYLGIYQRQELVAHESAHIGRMAFEEPKFEEFLAYRTSNSSFRKFFGSLVSSPRESLLFIITLLLTLGADLLDFAYDTEHKIGWIKLLPIALIFLALVRLGVRHRQFLRCWSNLNEILNNSLTTNAVIYRLQDKEIIEFGKMSKEEIKSYAKRSESLRWRLLRREYFSFTTDRSPQSYRTTESSEEH